MKERKSKYEGTIWEYEGDMKGVTSEYKEIQREWEDILKGSWRTYGCNRKGTWIHIKEVWRKHQGSTKTNKRNMKGREGNMKESAGIIKENKGNMKEDKGNMKGVWREFQGK